MHPAHPSKFARLGVSEFHTFDINVQCKAMFGSLTKTGGNSLCFNY